MLGAIFGDIVGSVYEFNNTHDPDFPLLTRWSRPTDDSIMSLAVAKALIETAGQSDAVIGAALVHSMQTLGRQYPNCGYGGMFRHWLRSADPQPYNSFGNGSAMRVAAAAIYAFLMEQDYKTAIPYYQASAQLGSSAAMCNLGYCYYYGRGVQRDKEMARYYWETSAVLGEAASTYKLGDMHRNGDIEADESVAWLYYCRAWRLTRHEKDILNYPNICLRLAQYGDGRLTSAQCGFCFMLSGKSP